MAITLSLSLSSFSNACFSLLLPMVCSDSDKGSTTIIVVCAAVGGAIVLAALLIVYARMRRRHGAQFSMDQVRKGEAYNNPMYDSAHRPEMPDASGGYDNLGTMQEHDGMYSDLEGKGVGGGGGPEGASGLKSGGSAGCMERTSETVLEGKGHGGKERVG